MPQQANQPGDVPIPGQQEGKMGQWNRNEGVPSDKQDVQQDKPDAETKGPPAAITHGDRLGS